MKYFTLIFFLISTTAFGESTYNLEHFYETQMVENSIEAKTRDCLGRYPTDTEVKNCLEQTISDIVEATENEVKKLTPQLSPKDAATLSLKLKSWEHLIVSYTEHLKIESEDHQNLDLISIIDLAELQLEKLEFVINFKCKWVHKKKDCNLKYKK